MVNLLEELREVVMNPLAGKAATMWQLDFAPVWPTKELKSSGMQKILRFVQYRLS
jgi:hypothetical protein